MKRPRRLKLDPSKHTDQRTYIVSHTKSLQDWLESYYLNATKSYDYRSHFSFLDTSRFPATYSELIASLTENHLTLDHLTEHRVTPPGSTLAEQTDNFYDLALRIVRLLYAVVIPSIPHPPSHPYPLV